VTAKEEVVMVVVVVVVVVVVLVFFSMTLIDSLTQQVNFQLFNFKSPGWIMQQINARR
jgi:hypothetical protein